MNLPDIDDFIDIHTHGFIPAKGIFAVENLMAHEQRDPESISARAFSAGIHPWYLNEANNKVLIKYIKDISGNPQLIALGEAGFDKLRGPSAELQRSAFNEQVEIADMEKKPVFIHCVKSWDELLRAHKDLRPSTPWMIHGFRGKKELAAQLISRGMFISFWFDFVIRPESAEIIRFLPKERIFLETDGADIDIKDIYKKVAADLDVNISLLKKIIFENFNRLFLGK